MNVKVTQAQENGYIISSFTANKTEYEVLTRDNKEFTVYSRRKGLSNWADPKVYDSLEDLSKRSKAFLYFAVLVSA